MSKLSRWAIIWAFICIHLWWGITFLFATVPLNTTPTSVLLSLMNQHRAGWLLLVISGLAMWGVLHTPRPGQFVLNIRLFPHHIVVLWSLIGPIAAIIRSSYADGVLRPRAFIANDQALYICAAAWHSVRLISLYSRR